MIYVKLKKDEINEDEDFVKFELITKDEFGQVIIKHPNGRLYLTRESRIEVVPIESIYEKLK